MTSKSPRRVKSALSNRHSIFKPFIKKNNCHHCFSLLGPRGEEQWDFLFHCLTECPPELTLWRSTDPFQQQLTSKSVKVEAWLADTNPLHSFETSPGQRTWSPCLRALWPLPLLPLPLDCHTAQPTLRVLTELSGL